MDCLVFIPHLARNRAEIFILRTIKSIEHGGRYNPGGGRGHELLGEFATRDFLEARDLVFDRLEVEIFQFALAFRRVLLLADMRKSPHQARDQLGKFLEFAPAPSLRYAAEAAHALRYIGLETDPLLFAVIADVDAGGELPLDHMA